MHIMEATNPVAAYEAAGAIIEQLCSEGREETINLDQNVTLSQRMPSCSGFLGHPSFNVRSL